MDYNLERDIEITCRLIELESIQSPTDEEAQEYIDLKREQWKMRNDLF